MVPLLSVFGGKFTTYRQPAVTAMTALPDGDIGDQTRFGGRQTGHGAGESLGEHLARHMARRHGVLAA
ncbi:hypothetical protein [Halomonas maura]|uniref:hypothetical protein n=1 Tax=Halomonas maura TaxID=117606 RepID=UPI0025B2C2A3|nr:hypothetical protein [Halomonas maura]MDN3554871.1 hypothetical protein [Halomonas maura]